LLIIGSPAKAVRKLTDEEIAGIRAECDGYAKRQRMYRTDLIRIS
jgi:carbonic anhydrase/acetyltransferase-like protein (isoleucine patch superfamily)